MPNAGIHGTRSTNWKPADYYYCWWGYGSLPDLNFDLSRNADAEKSITFDGWRTVHQHARPSYTIHVKGATHVSFMDVGLLPLPSEGPVRAMLAATRIDPRRMWRVTCDMLLAFFAPPLRQAAAPPLVGAATPQIATACVAMSPKQPAAPLLLGSVISEVLGTVMVFALLGIGLNIVVGSAGLLDLGYVAFVAIGAGLTFLALCVVFGGFFAERRLRDRLEDVPALVGHFAEQLAAGRQVGDGAGGDAARPEEGVQGAVLDRLHALAHPELLAVEVVVGVEPGRLQDPQGDHLGARPGGADRHPLVP